MNRGWTGGRALWLSVASATVTLSLLYFWWWVPIDGPWAPASNPRYVQMYELLPILGGTVALYGLQPRLDWVDLQSPRPVATFSTVAAGVAIAAFAALPMLTIWLWHVSDLYRRFLPEGIGLTDEGNLPGYGFFFAFACNIAIVLSLACLTTALAGRALGPLGAIAWFTLLLVGQGHLGLRGLASVTLNGDLPGPSLLGVGVAAAALTLGLYCYHRSLAGTRPIIPGHYP